MSAKRRKLMIKKLHHVGIAVNNLDTSVGIFQKMLGKKPESVETIDVYKVKAALFKVGDVEIELLEPTEEGSAVSGFLKKNGEGIHHICLETDDVDKELEGMAAKGIQTIDKKGRAGLAGKIGFLHPKSASGVLIELAQIAKK
jgi:methylmalonyl-CoA epimerase